MLQFDFTDFSAYFFQRGVGEFKPPPSTKDTVKLKPQNLETPWS